MSTGSVRSPSSAQTTRRASLPGVPLDSMPHGTEFRQKFESKYGQIQLYAPYCYDAKKPQLILLTGRTGDTGAHDYVDMLGDLGLLHRAHEVAALMKYFGVLLILLALVWGALLVRHSLRDR